MDELSEEDKLVVARARRIQQFLSQPTHASTPFSGIPGVYVELEDTIAGFNEILEGKMDDIPEQAFWMRSTADSVREKAEEMKSLAKKKSK